MLLKRRASSETILSRKLALWILREFSFAIHSLGQSRVLDLFCFFNT